MATSNDIGNNYPYIPLSARDNTTIESRASLFGASIESQAYQEIGSHFSRASGIRHATFERITSSEAPGRRAPRRTLMRSSAARRPVGTGPAITEHLFRPVEAEVEGIPGRLSTRPSLSERIIRRRPVPVSTRESRELDFESTTPRRPTPVSRPEHQELGFGIDSPLLSNLASQLERLRPSQLSENIRSQAAELANVFEAMENDTSNFADPEVWESTWNEAQAQNMAYESARHSALTRGSRNSTSARPATPFAYFAALPVSTPVSPRSSERSIPQRSPPTSGPEERGELNRGSGNIVGGFDPEAIIDEAQARYMSSELVYREHYRHRQADRARTAARFPSSPLPGASPARISSPTPQSTYTAPSGDSTCSICLETLTSTNQNFTTLCHCNHAFHHDCIHRWLQQLDHGRREIACPLCRQRVSTVVQNNGPNNEVSTPVDIYTFLARPMGGMGFVLERPRGALLEDDFERLERVRGVRDALNRRLRRVTSGFAEMER